MFRDRRKFLQRFNDEINHLTSCKKKERNWKTDQWSKKIDWRS